MQWSASDRKGMELKLIFDSQTAKVGKPIKSSYRFQSANSDDFKLMQRVTANFVERGPTSEQQTQRLQACDYTHKGQITLFRHT